jgi:F-type H+-transporting ATPase subunit b
MPQLDTFMYLSQVFWLLVLFTIFYILVLNNILPNISRVLKLRRKKISSEGSFILLEEYNVVMTNTSNVLEELLINLILSLSKTRISTFSWLEISLKEANEKTLLDLNKTYLKNVGELKGQSLLITDIIKQK